MLYLCIASPFRCSNSKKEDNIEEEDPMITVIFVDVKGNKSRTRKGKETKKTFSLSARRNFKEREE